MNSLMVNKQSTSNTLSNKSDNDSLSQKKNDVPKISHYIPTLKKNSKMTYVFGAAYFLSVKEAIFDVPLKPFMPGDLPESLKQSDSDLQPLYVCGQCKDCFRFSSTLDEHTARRSWVLGYWCQHCFQERCSHVPKGRPMCSTCLSSQFYKRAYLRTKGMKKGQRAAIIRLFYNQCQFFAHLKAHSIANVDLNDLMLMPIPIDVEKKDHPKLEKACKSLMEYGFLNRLHIMEILREQKADSHWWNPPQMDSNSEPFSNHPEGKLTIPVIINTFRESDLFEKVDETVKKNRLANKNSPPVSKSSPADNTNNCHSNTSSSFSNNVSVTYYHSPYRPPTDIAFVDCGPSHPDCNSKQKKPEYSPPRPTRESNYFPVNKNVSSISSNQIPQNSSQPPTTSTPTSIACSSSNKIYTMSTSNTTTSTGPKISVKKFASEPASNWGQLGENSEQSNNQSQPANANTKILTVHSEKCLDLSSIISQLPPDVMNSKKIVFIEQNSNQLQYQKNSQGNKNSGLMSSVPTLSANCIKVVPQRRLISAERDRNKPIPILPAVSQVKKISQPAFNNMMKPNFSTNSVSKTKTFAMSTVTKPTMKTLSTEQKFSSSKLNVSPSKNNYSQQISTNPSAIKFQQINSYDGRIFYQSGKKYVLKQTNKMKSPSAPPSNSVLRNTSQVPSKVQPSNTSIQMPKSMSYTINKAPSKTLPKIFTKSAPVISNSNSPLTPSPSPSELSSSSSCDVQTKQVVVWEKKSSSKTTFSKQMKIFKSKFDLKNLSIKEQKLLYVKCDSSAKLFLHLSENLSSMKKMRRNVSRYKQDMMDTFPHLMKEDIQKRIDHLKKVGEDYSKVIQNSNAKVLQNHTRLIKILEDSMEQAKILSITGNTEEQSQKGPETDENCCTLDNWEEQEMQKCPFCEKLKKPNNYLPGFSRLSANESYYCQCYNCQCNTCNTFQGILPRFAAHINYHEKNKPHTCPECMRRFSSFDLLEDHVWLNCFHPLVKNWMFGCKICGIDGLTTIESLTRHFLIMHSEIGFVCSECKRIFFSESLCRKHLESEHRKENHLKNGDDNEKNKLKETDKLPDPVEIIMCKAGQCIIMKENFQSHLIDHLGVEEQVFYKCPFCSFSKRATVNAMELFRDHIFSNHSHIIPQYTNFKSLNYVQERFKKQESNNEEVLPMIVNTRTIAQEAFEKGTQDEESHDNQSLSVDKLESGMPMIVDVRSEAVDLNSAMSTMDSIPKILEVKSIANDSFPLLKESNNSELPRRKSSTVIEITISPKKISSKEVTNGKVDEKLTESKTENSIVREKSVEKENSVSRENTTVEKNVLVYEKDSAVQEISTFTEDNSIIKEKSLELAENSEKNEVIVASVNALEDLKAKMSRTFKTLAKKMEASTTTLQQEFSKCQPKFQNILEAEDNISQSDFHMEIEENVEPVENEIPHKNVSQEAIFFPDIVQPPPLSRIPQHLLNNQLIVEDEQTRKSRKRKRIDKIAFNGPLSFEEAVVDFKCHVCGKMIDSSWPVLKSHFNIWHQDEYKISVLNPQLLKISSDYIEGGYKEVLAKKYKIDSSPRKKKRRTRFAAKIAEKASMNKSAGICVTTESVEEDDGTFKCKKCDLRCSDMENLREHISKNHRIKGRYLICLECGENFVVAPSLQMHLKAFHAIEDPLTYLLQNTAFAPENMEDTEEEEEEVTTEANQCYVCMAVFEGKAAVDKHLRVHGMAFLNRKRIEAKKSLNSPEKKIEMVIETVEETQNSNANLNSEKLQEDKPAETGDASLMNSPETEVPVH